MASDIQTDISGAGRPQAAIQPGEVILRTEGLTKHYGGVHALVDCNFEIRKGEHVAIMGDNGAGKSTFVRQITAVEQRTVVSIEEETAVEVILHNLTDRAQSVVISGYGDFAVPTVSLALPPETRSPIPTS